jgi:putative DNA primase/helicase
METAAFVTGDYADTVPIETFLQPTARRSGSQPTPDLAKLPGVRYLRIGEPDKGAKLNESLIKRATGGDPIDARDLNKSFFTYFVQFKLTIACNPKPRITGTDGGIWRRVILVPWLETIPEAEWDRELKAKLRGEGSGILNRLLEGLPRPR